MARPYSELLELMDPAHVAISEAMTRTHRLSMALADLRDSMDVAHPDVARVLELNGPALPTLEHRFDTDLLTLRDGVQARGGELLIDACFPTGLVAIAPQWESLDEDGETYKASFAPAVSLLVLRVYIEALGGTLWVHARFPTGLMALAPAQEMAKHAVKIRRPSVRQQEKRKPAQRRIRKPPEHERAVSVCEVYRASKRSVPVKSK